MFHGKRLAPWDSPTITYCPDVPYQRTWKAPTPPPTRPIVHLPMCYARTSIQEAASTTTVQACPQNLPVASSPVQEDSSTPITTQEASSPEINCPICLNTFTRPVKTIPCNHTFCFECLRLTFAAAGHCGCPLCRTKVVGRRPPSRELLEQLRKEKEQKSERESQQRAKERQEEERAESIFPAERPPREREEWESFESDVFPPVGMTVSPSELGGGWGVTRGGC